MRLLPPGQAHLGVASTVHVCRHPQILLLPLQQYQRNIGYLLGQGLTRAEVLRMWGQRAGLLIEPLKAVHGEVLGLRAAGRPLQVGRVYLLKYQSAACHQMTQHMPGAFTSHPSCREHNASLGIVNLLGVIYAYTHIHIHMRICIYTCIYI